MQSKRLVLAGAGAFLFICGSISYGADQPTTAPTASSPNQIYLIRENPFFGLHIEKAVQHAREAEIAGNMGEAEVLLEHARISLMQAHEAQRAGNVPGLNEGIANLKKAVSLSTWMPQASAQTTSAEMAQPSMEKSSADMQASTQTSSPDMQASTQATTAEMPQASTQAPPAQATVAKAQSGTSRADASLRSATDAVREARKNLSEAGGLKYKEIKPQTVKTVAQ